MTNVRSRFAGVIALLGLLTVSASVASATLTGSLSLSRTDMAAGQTVLVVLTVSNTGVADATNIVPQVFVAGPAVISAPAPLTATQLGANDWIAFTWTATANSSAAGSIAFQTSAVADGPDSTGLSIGSVVIDPAALDARLNASKATVTAGQVITLVLTVTNTGGTAPTTVLPKLWASTTTVAVSAANPASAASLAPSAKATFTWTATMTAAAGVVTFTASAAGDGVVFSQQSTANVTVQTPAAVSAKFATTSATVAGGSFMLVLSVSNSGQATANVTVATTSFVASVAKTTVTPYTPAGTTTYAVSGGATVTITWTITAGVAATGVSLSNTIYVADANGGPALPNLWAKSNTFAVTALAAFKGVLGFAGTPAGIGQPVQFVLTVTNTGGTTLTNTTAYLTTDGPATVDAAPTPVTVATLAPGAAAKFTWNVVPQDNRAMTFTAYAQGFTQSVTGAVVVTSANLTAVLPGVPAPDPKVTFLYPSPAHDLANIAYTMDESGSVAIRVYNGAGRLVATLDDTQPAGTRSTALTTSKLAPGLYYYILKWTYDSGRTVTSDVRKFVVVH